MQGVGFRPYIHRLATARKLDGFVRNDAGGLVIDVQGDSETLDEFLETLTASPPPLAAIRHVHSAVADVDGASGFSIIEEHGHSTDAESRAASRALLPLRARADVSPDVATCDDCLRELFDNGDRRFGYPFINCTNCGPRLTIIQSLPYDRPNTTMAAFPMCARCRSEYEDPADRRFHAQPISCPDCGPALKFVGVDGARESSAHGALDEAIATIARGDVIAIKGLGGYHLACDATSARAVALLRARKRREARPLALMIRDTGAALTLCDATPGELALLESRERPIVLLRRKRSIEPALMAALDEVAPGTDRLGVMLPYTPLHHLLMTAVGRPIVMTSGNLSDEPIAFEDGDARNRLGQLVDAILSHDRPIATGCDDTVMLMVRDAPAFIRRSRGFAPRPIESRLSFPCDLLAVGGELKNTFCVARGQSRSAFVSHHVGDLRNVASRQSLVNGIRHYFTLFGVSPDVVAHDLHPDYTSTRLAADLECAQVGVQHHHAHVASCMAEHGLVGSVIGVVFDGAGFGTDGATWGGEFLLVNEGGSERVGHLGYVALPGGDAAARRPARMAISHVWSAFGGQMPPGQLDLARRLASDEMRVLGQMLAKGVNCPPTSSVGRLFDAVAALAGARDTAQFEGQAAMELEAIADPRSARSYAADIADDGSALVIDPGSIIRAVTDDLRARVSASEISTAFHNGLAHTIADAVERIRRRTGVNRVVLSGGVFQNVLLITRAASALERAGFEVFTQRLVPCNDGGLSLGQAYVVALSKAEA